MQQLLFLFSFKHTWNIVVFNFFYLVKLNVHNFLINTVKILRYEKYKQNINLKIFLAAQAI